MSEEKAQDELQRLVLHHTDLPPCCVRINPQNHDIIYLGTYKLVKDSERYGSIEIYEIQEDKQLVKLNDFPVDSAILDLKFHPTHKNLLISAHSKGNIRLWRVEEDTPRELTLLQEFQVFEQNEDILITSVVCHPVFSNQLAVTSTSGELIILKLSPSGLSIESMVKSTSEGDPEPHDLECWTAEFGTQQGLANVVFSGGDDRKLIAYDTRTDQFPQQQPIFKTDRLHDAGIVSILTAGSAGTDFCVNSNPYSLWTGSYDDHLKVLDLRVMPPMEPIHSVPPVVKESLYLGGGVWRLIPNNMGSSDKLLSCNMYDGARILKHDGQGREVSVDKYFKGDHESMCYGGDWIGERLVTCSFYDNVVQVWENP